MTTSRSSSTELVDIRTGETLPDIGEVPTDKLAGLLAEIRYRETNYKAWRALCEEEIRSRMKDAGRRAVALDGWKIELESSKGRAWDADDLEAAVRELLDDGVLVAGEITGLIKHETKVDGTKARDLLNRLESGSEAHRKIAACFRWEAKGKDRVTVSPEES